MRVQLRVKVLLTVSNPRSNSIPTFDCPCCPWSSGGNSDLGVDGVHFFRVQVQCLEDKSSLKPRGVDWIHEAASVLSPLDYIWQSIFRIDFSTSSIITFSSFSLDGFFATTAKDHKMTWTQKSHSPGSCWLASLWSPSLESFEQGSSMSGMGGRWLGESSTLDENWARISWRGAVTSRGGQEQNKNTARVYCNCQACELLRKMCDWFAITNFLRSAIAAILWLCNHTFFTLFINITSGYTKTRSWWASQMSCGAGCGRCSQTSVLPWHPWWRQGSRSGPRPWSAWGAFLRSRLCDQNWVAIEWSQISGTLQSIHKPGNCSRRTWTKNHDNDIKCNTLFL